jgi:hypothetical protein
VRSEDLRYRVTVSIAWLAWVSAGIGTVITVFGVSPRPLGALVVMLIGVGVTASLALSRMRLAETITEVFVTGLRLHKAQQCPNCGSMISLQDRDPHP